ncbi:MAG: pilus assembly protein [Candidatus Dormibacteraeota bacterium]|nr:pilus assembly protein [Candidatus Dormibacteraeota bacterium]
MTGRTRPHRSGQAMVEFAMVLPLVLAIMFVVISISMVYAIKIAEQKATYNGAVFIARLSDDPSAPDKKADPFNGIDRLPVGVLTDPVYWGPAGDPKQSRALGVAIAVVKAQKTLRPTWLDNFVDDKFANCPGAHNNPEVSTGPDVKGNPDGFYAVMSIKVRYCYHLANIPGWDQLAGIWGTKNGNGTLLEEDAIAARVAAEY